MATEFDREMDALLRARGNTRLAGGPRSPDVEHIDADGISAFVENVMPAGARQRYTAHFADCEACRGLLKDVIALSAEETVATAALAADAAVAESPWYRKLFLTQRLAYGMGALVLLFSAFLGYLVVQNESISERAATLRDEAGDTSVRDSQSTIATSANAATNVANDIMSSNSASNAAQSFERDMTGEVSTPTRSAATTSGTAGTADTAAAETSEDDEAVVLAERGDPSTLAAPPPPPAAAAERREEAEREDQLRARQQAIPSAGAPSATQSGPSRRSMERDNRAEDLVKMSPGVAVDALTTRVVAGKTFDRKDGVWYDRAYTNQPMTNVARNTAAYRKLDKSLRVIAESLPGVVIVVEKARALRIQ